MTTPLELLHDLFEADIRLTLVDDKLIAKPSAKVTPELIERIRGQKERLVSVMSGPTDCCDHCGGRVVRDRTFDGYLNRMCIACGRWFTCTRSQESNK